ncbi:MAG: Flp pilus assembly complex ATPase component TadA [Phycisphaeraceae bacterium]|nr:MAG: Flp pilus assembly complex ATPase component TadA [Phycisphaeraceae bacterium]
MGIGVILAERGLITRSQLEEAIAEQRRSGERLDHVLVRLGFVSRAQVLEALGDQFHMPVVDLAATAVEREVLGTLPAQLVYRQNCVPISRDNGTLTVATSDPFELTALDELRLLTGCSIELVLADEEELHKFIRSHYGVGGDTLDAMSATAAEIEGGDQARDEVEQAQEASVIKLVNDLLIEAINERATDVHIEPYEGELIVRYRIDGVLQRANIPPTINRFASAIISRLKIMATLNIAEKRKPQDGRITFSHRNKEGKIEEFDLRVSVIPMLFGEGVVLRVLNKSAVLLQLEDLGMPRHVLTPWDEMIKRPHGIVLVTGPTGSGKSTTLYASLNRIVSDEIKCITVEDPVEYHVPGVNQIQVNTKVGLTFSAGLRSILRHDPDAVMVGEIRDRETAETAVQASLTGHIVFSTLHTNDAAGAVTRLIDMGVEPFLIASSVEGVLAQRLVRRVCHECEAAYVPDNGDLPRDFRLGAGQTLTKGEGCRACRHTGFRGRVGIYELLSMDTEIRDMIMQRINAPTIAEHALKSGHLCTLRQDGYAKTLDGVTTMTEVMRALAV